jgi:hypothetical protein
MALSKVVTEVVNPGSMGRKVKSMAKKLSDKQIRFFGTAAQRAGLKRRRAASRVNAGRKHKKSFKKASRPATHRMRSVPVKKNPIPQILTLSLGNAARKGSVKMAKSKKHHKKHFAGAHRNAGRKSMHVKRFRGRGHRNPGMLGSVMDWVKGGIGVLGGVVVTRGLPQLVLADANQGAVGYLANGVTAALAGWASHLLFPRERVITASVLAGGFAALLARVIGDYTTYGKYLSLTGVGDYMVWNGVTPQRLVDPNQAMVEIPAGWGAPPPVMAIQSSGADMMGAGMDMGRRAGVC